MRSKVLILILALALCSTGCTTAGFEVSGRGGVLITQGALALGKAEAQTHLAVYGEGDGVDRRHLEVRTQEVNGRLGATTQVSRDYQK